MIRPTFKATTRLVRSVVRSRPTTFTSFDDAKLSYEVWGPTDGRGPVVLNHGFAVDTRVNWFLTGIIDQLVKAEFTVIGLDARGHGKSEKFHDPSRYGEDAMAKDVSALFDVLELETVDVVGYSMGAIVSIITAAQDTRVRSLVVGGVGKAVVETGGLDTNEMSNIDIAAALISDDPEIKSRPGVSGFRTLADLMGADRQALSAVALAARSGLLPLDRITARTLILAGVDDPLAKSPELLAEAIANAKLVTVPGDHLGAVGESAFVKAIIEFLQEVDH